MKKIRIKRISTDKKNIIIVLAILLILSLSVTLGRFVYNKLLDFYFTTKQFFFESDKLTSDGASYLLDYWNGVDPYNVVINLNNFKNSKLKSKTDISYEVSYNCSSTVICDSTKKEGVIYKDGSTDQFVVTMTPNSSFKDGDKVVISIVAKSTEPYVKKLSAQFQLVVGKYGFSYEIEDKKGNVYMELNLTNTLNYYTVRQAFGNYKVGDRVSESDYVKLNDADKEKCVSAEVTLDFDPNVVYIDNNNTNFLNAYDIGTTKINNFDYINKFTFKMDSSSSNSVKFYKKDVNKDYSSVGNDGIINVNFNI